MKRAYQYISKVKSSLAIGNVIENYRDAQSILISPPFKALESNQIRLIRCCELRGVAYCYVPDRIQRGKLTNDHGRHV